MLWDELLIRYEQVRSTGTPRVILLESEVGRGKTYAIQRLYDEIARRYGGNLASRLTCDDAPHSLEELNRQRRRLYPEGQPMDATPPLLWLAARAGGSAGLDLSAEEFAARFDQLVSNTFTPITAEAARIVARAAADIGADQLGISTVKTIAEAGLGLAALVRKRTGWLHADEQQVELAAQHAKVTAGLRRLGLTEREVAGRGVDPLVVVVDDAHAAGEGLLRILTSILVPAIDNQEMEDLVPLGVLHRQAPILLVLAAWPHAYRSAAYQSKPLSTWVSQLARCGLEPEVLQPAAGLDLNAATAHVNRLLPTVIGGDARDIVAGAAFTSAPGRAPATVNPLVLMMRIASVAGHIQAVGDSPCSLADQGIEVGRLPRSPTDPLRELYERLPADERRTVALAGIGGPVVPWGLLCSDAIDPGQALSQAIDTGFVSIDKHPIRLLSSVGFCDELAPVFFKEERGRLPIDPESELLAVAPSRITNVICETATHGWCPGNWGGRLLGLLAPVAHAYPATIESLPLLKLALEAIWPMGSAEVARVGRSQAVRQRLLNAPAGTSDELLAIEVLPICAAPNSVTSITWSRVFSRSRYRELVARNPGWLVSQAIALNPRTLPCRELVEPLREVIAGGGYFACHRLLDVYQTIAPDSILGLMQECKESFPEAGPEVDLALARIRGPVDELRVLQTRPISSLRERLQLAAAYARAGQLEDSVSLLRESALVNPDAAVQVARYLNRMGRTEEAVEALAPLADQSVNAATLSAAILSQVDATRALSLLMPYIGSYDSVREQASKLLKEQGRYQEAIDLIAPLAGTSRSAEQALRSLRTRREGGEPREKLLAKAEELWRAGDTAEAAASLTMDLADPAVLSVYAEYAWVLGQRAEVMECLVAESQSERRLAISAVELAHELTPDETSGWLARLPDDDKDVNLGLLRLHHRDGGSDGARAAASVMMQDGRSPSRIISMAEGLGTEARNDFTIAITLERAGHQLWSLEILERWRDSRSVGHRARIMVQNGFMLEARELLSHERSRQLAVCGARALLQLADGDCVAAAGELAQCRPMTDQLRRVCELLPSAKDDRTAALGAFSLLAQMRQQSLAVAVLASAASSHPDVLRQLRRTTKAAPEDSRRAIGRLRRRNAIRGAFYSPNLIP